GREQSNGHSKEQRIDGAFDGAKDERHEGELWFGTIGAGCGLPGITGLWIALIPDLAEERGDGGFGMGNIKAPKTHAAFFVDRQNRVVARGENEGCEARFIIAAGEGENMTLARRVIKRDIACR